jgi:aminoglycoside 6'-N-acetyltransferase I
LPDITIRPLAVSDRDEWLRMRLALWPDDDMGALLAELDVIAADPLQPVFVAERAGGGLGAFVEAGTRSYGEGCETAPVGYIEGWYVDEDLRRQGLGGLLLRAVEDWARSQGLKEIGSDTWLWNEASIRAHESLGYHETERLVHFCKTLE